MKILILLIISASVVIFNLPLYHLILCSLILFKLKNLSRIKQLMLPIALIFLFQWLFSAQLNFTAILRLLTLSLLAWYYVKIFSPAQINKDWRWLPRPLPQLLTLTLVLIPVLFKEAEKISWIQQSRGLSSKRFLALIIPLLHRTFQRSEQIALILECRL